MKKSDLNKAVLENFILWFTHKNEDEARNEGENPDVHHATALDLYEAIESYIEEDHVDGRGNPEDHIVTYGVESSFEVEDEEERYPEEVVVVADFGEEEGTQTVITLSDIANKDSLEHLIRFIKDPYRYGG